MSAVLLELAEPLLDELPDPPDPEMLRSSLLLAAVAWNISRLTDARRRKQEIREATRHRDFPEGGDPEEFVAIIGTLAEWARSRWPDHEQMVVDVEVAPDRRHGLRVNVLSARPG